MKLMIQRTKMAGMESRAYSYNVWVPLDSLPQPIRQHQKHLTVIGGREYVDFATATLPLLWVVFADPQSFDSEKIQIQV